MTNYILSQFLYESKNSTIDIINRIAFLFFRFKISKRIGTLSILPDFKMQVVSGRIAGGTDISDHFPLFHFLTYGHADRGAVGIQGVKSIIVAYLDMISISTAPRVDGIGNGILLLTGNQGSPSSPAEWLLPAAVLAGKAQL